MAAVRTKTAPGPMLSAGWQDGDPAPVVMQTGARHRADLQDENVTRRAAERHTPCANFHEKAATSENPGVDDQQWREALTRANDIRLARTALKRKVKAGEIKLSDLVFASAEIEEIQNATVFDVLRWKPRIGYTVARKLTYNVIGETATFARFATYSETTRQRLIDRLVERGA